ncbi:SCP2 sterol-binding domain-containing protein [Rhodobacteraceae bacterium D3-12]|nr:SCP2 sterol-binding domain-containing protein [Rhodobacteraceae bacterium D3-12]
MSVVIEEFLSVLQPKVKGILRGTAKLVITDVGVVMLDETGARVGDGAADVTLKATETVFRNIMDGTQNPVMAVMSGKLGVEGSSTRALKVGQILTGA